jgi:hypothetical protein
MGKSEKTVRRDVKEHPDYEIIKNEIKERDRDKVEEMSNVN